MDRPPGLDAVADAAARLAAVPTADEAAAVTADALATDSDCRGRPGVVLYETTGSTARPVGATDGDVANFPRRRTVARRALERVEDTSRSTRRIDDGGGVTRVVPVDDVGAVAVVRDDRGPAVSEAAIRAIGSLAVVAARSRTLIADQEARLAELERENERLTEFASIVAHDLRNPLSVARGHLELAAESGDAEHFDRVRTAHERIDGIVEHTLAIAREGGAAVDTESIDLETVATDAWDGVETAEATLAVDGTARIEADRERLRELFANLFRNAVEHAGAAPTVRVGPTVDGFYVADDGPGIPGDRRSTVFEPGCSSSAGGAGIGLTIVQELAASHGWDVDVGESIDGGARFEITSVGFATE